jgi:hypothetical protein
LPRENMGYVKNNKSMPKSMSEKKKFHAKKSMREKQRKER